MTPFISYTGSLVILSLGTVVTSVCVLFLGAGLAFEGCVGLDGTLVNHHSLLLCRFVELIFSQGLLFTLTKILIFINQS